MKPHALIIPLHAAELHQPRDPCLGIGDKFLVLDFEQGQFYYY